MFQVIPRVWFVVIMGILTMACDQPAPQVVKSKTVYVRSDVEMALVKVSEHIYYVQGAAGMATDNEGFISNAGVVITDEGVVLFDALGTPSLANMLLSKIREITDKPIIKVIVSHYHADHIYGLQVFKEQGAEIIAPKEALDYLASEQASQRLEERQFSLEPWVNEATYLVMPDKLISENTSFTFGGLTFQLNLLGAAHSEGDMTLFVEPDRCYSPVILFLRPYTVPRRCQYQNLAADFTQNGDLKTGCFGSRSRSYRQGPESSHPVDLRVSGIYEREYG